MKPYPLSRSITVALDDRGRSLLRPVGQSPFDEVERRPRRALLGAKDVLLGGPWPLRLMCLLTLALACGGDDEVIDVDGGPRDARVGLDGDIELDADIGLDADIDAGASADGGVGEDASTSDDASVGDGGGDGGGGVDAGAIDGGSTEDAGFDAGTDAGFDAGTDAGFDAGTDAGFDAGVVVGDCISGATGTHAVRFRWAGSGSGSTAYVMYERNQLPDTSRWRVRALSMNIGYTPVFSDVFLGEGGLDFGGTVFMDVELSTLGLGAVRNVTIAVYGRSFNTTSSGSFSWQTFSGTGAAPSGLVSNSAPYQWYRANATAVLPAGNDGTLLRIRPGPPSNRLVVNRVEICFDAD